MSKIIHKYAVINTAILKDNNHPSSSRWVYNLTEPIENILSIQCTQATIPYSFYMINSRNNVLSIYEELVSDPTTNQTRIINLPEGNYDPGLFTHKLLEYINNYNNVNGSGEYPLLPSSQDGYEYDYTDPNHGFNDATNKMYPIISAQGGFKFQFLFGDYTNNCHSILGFDNVNTSLATSLSPSTIMNFNSYDCLHLHLNNTFFQNTFDSYGIRRNILVSFPIDTAQNSYINYQGQSPEINEIPDADSNDISMDYIDLTLTDANMNEIDVFNFNCYFKIEFICFI